jgi:hypothetical protein
VLEKTWFMQHFFSNRIFLVFLLSLLFVNCSAPLIQTTPGLISDTSDVTITCNGASGNKGLLDVKEPVYVHVGLITDSSVNPNHWRYVKFIWGLTQDSALAKPVGTNSWSYTIPHIRKFFGVPDSEKIESLAILFRTGNCIDTNCHVLRNVDGSNIYIPLNAGKQEPK